LVTSYLRAEPPAALVRTITVIPIIDEDVVPFRRFVLLVNNLIVVSGMRCIQPHDAIANGLVGTTAYHNRNAKGRVTSSGCQRRRRAPASLLSTRCGFGLGRRSVVVRSVLAAVAATTLAITVTVAVILDAATTSHVLTHSSTTPTLDNGLGTLIGWFLNTSTAT
jgi:hypothetical protein